MLFACGKHQIEKVRDKVWKQNCVSMRYSTPGVKVVGFYPCVNLHYNFFFNLVIEVISCDILCLFTRVAVKYYETKRKLFQQSLPEDSKKADKRRTSYAQGGRG